MNLVKGSPYYSTDIVNKDFSDSAMYYTRENFVFNEMTASTSEYQEFHPRLLGDKRKVKNGTLQVNVNGWPMRSISGSTIDQSISSNGVEFFLDSTYKKVRIKKLYVEDENKVAGERVLLGIDLNSDDIVSFKYQQETSQMPLIDPIRQLKPAPSSSRVLQSSVLTSSDTGLPTLQWGQVGLEVLGTGSIDMGSGTTLSTGYINMYNNIIRNSLSDTSIQLLVDGYSSGSVKIWGDLVVEGSQSIQNTVTFAVEDSILDLNFSGSTALAAQDSGLNVGRNGLNNARLLWDESETSWMVDKGTGTLQTIGGATGSGFLGSTNTNMSSSTMLEGANLTFEGGGEVQGLPGTPSTGSAAVSYTFVSESLFSYARNTTSKKADTVTAPSTASFNSVYTASAPDGFSSTNKDDFIFFINGQYMEHEAVTIRQEDSNLKLYIDSASLGMEFDADDEIVGWGKFTI